MIPWRLLSVLALAGVSLAIQVDSPEPWHVAILFQPVVLKCQYDTSANQPPTIVWKYKSFCRDRILDAFNPSSSTNLVNDQLLQADPNYDPYVNCPDASRTVRIVASKRGKAVSLDQYYQGRKITIIGDADLSIEQTAWGDSGVYYCTVTAFEDLSGNNEAYVELLVLGRTEGNPDFLPGLQIGSLPDWLFVVLVCLGAFVLLILIGVCWCQCCPHTCCCYLRCPCCPDKCCCPYALYHAGKAATAGAPSVYAPSSYAASAYSHPGLAKMGPPAPFMVPMTQFNGSYGSEFDAASSVGNHSRVPLLHDQDAPSSVRSGYRIQANQQNDDMRVLYYVEKELANFDPRAPSDPVGRYENAASAMSEISSLHDGPPPSRLLPRDPPPRLPPWEEERGGSSAGSSVSRQNPRRTSPPRGRERGWGDSRQRARSMESLDEISWGGGGGWGRRGGGERERERERGRGRGERTPLSRDRSPERRYLSRSRDDLTEREWERERERETGGRDRGRGGREREKGGRDPPQPPPYTETESVASSSRSKNEKKLRKNDAVSRESLVV